MANPPPLGPTIKKTVMLKAIRAWVPKGAQLRDALSVAKKFKVRKGDKGSIRKGQAELLDKELMKRHDVKSSYKGFSTAGASAHNLVRKMVGSQMTGDDSAIAANKAKLEEKQKINEALKAKTAQEHSSHETSSHPPEKERESVVEKRGVKETVAASRESEAQAIKIQEEKSGKKGAAATDKKAAAPQKGEPMQLARTALPTLAHHGGINPPVEANPWERPSPDPGASSSNEMPPEAAAPEAEALSPEAEPRSASEHSEPPAPVAPPSEPVAMDIG